MVETKPPALMVNVPLMVDDAPKLTPVLVLTLLKAAVPETVCVPVPAKAITEVPERARVPELVKVVPLVLLLMVRVLAVAVRVPVAFTTTPDVRAAVFWVTE